MPETNPGAYLLQPRPYPTRLSLVVPVYNEEAVVPFLRDALNRFLPELRSETEIILVNDGSTDTTLKFLAQWAKEDRRVKVLNLSRNFGHQIALTAGLDYSTGDAVILLDADLQDPLNAIHRMIDRYSDGYDVVYGRRLTRAGETIFKRFSAWVFYRLMRRFVHQELPVDTGDFRLLSSRCIEALQKMRETQRFLRGMVTWVGFPQTGVEYERSKRVAGTTKYPLSKMLMFAWTAATSFSTLPLKASIWLGLIATLLGIGEAVHALLAKMFHWYVVPGWSSLTVLISLLGGVTLVSIGVLGEYVGKLFEQTKNRPLYIVSQTMNINVDHNKESRTTVHSE